MPAYHYHQANKRDKEQPTIASQLQPLVPGATVDAAVVGCGPAGLYLAAQLAQRGLSVGLIGEEKRSMRAAHGWLLLPKFSRACSMDLPRLQTRAHPVVHGGHLNQATKLRHPPPTLPNFRRP
jgi:choline dehydrogenase-like flavoprotein